jgi:hypothetical protein
MIRSHMFGGPRAAVAGGSPKVGEPFTIAAILAAILVPLAIKLIQWLAEQVWNLITGLPKTVEQIAQSASGRQYMSAPVSATEDLALARKRVGVDGMPSDVKPTDEESAKFFAETQKYFDEHKSDIEDFIIGIFTPDDEQASTEGALGTPIGSDYDPQVT